MNNNTFNIITFLNDNILIIAFVFIMLIVIYKDEMWEVIKQVIKKILPFIKFKTSNKESIVLKDTRECRDPENISLVRERQIIVDSYLSGFIDTVKAIFVFKEEAIIPVNQENEFLGHITSLISLNKTKTIVFDLTKTIIINDVMLGVFRQLVDLLVSDCVKLTIVLPMTERHEHVKQKYCDFFEYVTTKIKQSQNYNIKIKYDSYASTILNFDDLYMHKFFETMDNYLHYRIPSINIENENIKRMMVLFLSIKFMSYKFMYLHFLNLYKEGKISLDYFIFEQVLEKTTKLYSSLSLKYNIPEEFLLKFNEVQKSMIDPYRESIKQIFDNEWYHSNEERLNAIFDNSLFSFSQTFVDIYKANTLMNKEYSDIVIETVDYKKLREEVKNEAFKKFII